MQFSSRAKFAALAIIAVLASSGCRTSQAVIRNTALERAAFDLNCPSSSLTASQLGATTRLGATAQSYGVERSVIGVTGCGQKAVYVVECGQADSCNAQLNADTKPASSEAAP